jgi:hypothetical protein
VRVSVNVEEHLLACPLLLGETVDRGNANELQEFRAIKGTARDTLCSLSFSPHHLTLSHVGMHNRKTSLEVEENFPWWLETSFPRR